MELLIENLSNNPFVISLNNVTVSSSKYSDTNFSGGNQNNTVAVNNSLQLNLTSFSSLITYSDNFLTTKYLTDSVGYNGVGYDPGEIFTLQTMTSLVGNITYRFTSPTIFYNASVSISTLSGIEEGGANTSMWYSYDNSTWNILNSTISAGVNLVSQVPVNGKNVFYIMLASDHFGYNLETPINYYGINYTQYQYASSGNFTSIPIYLPNVSYTVLRWDQNLSGAGTINLSIRQSNDGINWGAWGNGYTNNLNNPITSLNNPYLQYMAFLSTTNTNVTPILYDTNISYFNASTNSTGGYNYNITIPTDSLGVLPLQVYVSLGPQKFVGLNTTNITITALTSVPYSVVRNYSQSVSNYSVFVNFTRIDTGALVNGVINVSITNILTGNNYSQICYGSQCIASWIVPNDIVYGNYTVNITASNVSAYYLNTSTGLQII